MELQELHEDKVGSNMANIEMRAKSEDRDMHD